MSSDATSSTGSLNFAWPAMSSLPTQLALWLFLNSDGWLPCTGPGYALCFFVHFSIIGILSRMTFRAVSAVQGRLRESLSSAGSPWTYSFSWVGEACEKLQFRSHDGGVKSVSSNVIQVRCFKGFDLQSFPSAKSHWERPQRCFPPWLHLDVGRFALKI